MSFSLRRQHKKCAELVYELVRCQGEHGDISALQAEYSKLVDWMGLRDLPLSWRDRYHYHMQHAGCSIDEDRFLVDCEDRSESASTVLPYLPVAIYLDRLRSAHNVGSIVRTVEAYRLGEVHFSPGMMAPTHPQVVKTAKGCASLVRCHEGSVLSSLAGPIIAVETCRDAISLYDFRFPESFTLAFGNEEEGCSSETLSLADVVVRIPLYGCKNSLNVSNAFSIVAYEISRQLRRS